jgi:hypothetical protein
MGPSRFLWAPCYPSHGMRRAVTMTFLALLAVGCGTKEYHCRSERDCLDRRGSRGLCIETYCAFESHDCASGYRFDDSAGPYADSCVDRALVPPRDAGLPDA